VTQDTKQITAEMIAAVESLIGLHFSDEQRKMMLSGLADLREQYAQIHAQSVPYTQGPALNFNPRLPDMYFQNNHEGFHVQLPEGIERPSSDEAIAFLSVSEQAALMRTGQISSLELTTIYLERIKRYGPRLNCIVTITEELALQQAQRADDELAAGHYRGPLHGIPYGAKDLFATKDILTTWGDIPYKEQVFDYNAAVIDRLEEAGAVLVAKLSLGALAWGDVWFKGRTNNPWNLETGTSGSSAGSGAAVASGLVSFALGTETNGSIIYPSAYCGITGLRPSFGRISRYGAMPLSWSMDKTGPMCRSVEDCALLLDVLHGPDQRDAVTLGLPGCGWDGNHDIQGLRLGYVPAAFESDEPAVKNARAALDLLSSLGAELIPISLPLEAANSISFILQAEAAAAFDELLRSGQVELLTRQVEDAWPNVFRLARTIPAVEYIQANRIRTGILQEMAQLFESIDAYLLPFGFSHHSTLSNLTGHPAIGLPSGFDHNHMPTSLECIAQLYDEATLLRLASAFQHASSFHLQHPELTD
jgi:Asp-tRNA(Asn)/Glu-tRNA(Gln) amidotransferase A subunit family amidase